MKELDSVIKKLNAVKNKANSEDKQSVDGLIDYAEFYKKQFNEAIERLKNSSNELIEKINSTSSVKEVE